MKQTVFYDDGTSVDLYSVAPNIPLGYSLYQIGEYQVAPSGNPAVILLHDEADTVFDDDWQMYLYIINFGMRKNNVSSLMGSSKALMNNSTGIGGSVEREDLISGQNLGAAHPYLDKLRTFSRNTHACKDLGNGTLQLLLMDGRFPPPMKPGRPRPGSIEEIDNGRVTVDDYLYTPKSHPHLFLVCNNFNIKPGGVTTISPFPNGLLYDWTTARNEIYTFFPFVTHHTVPVISDKSLWTKVSSIGNPYRRI